MATEIRCLFRDDHEVADAGANLDDNVVRSGRDRVNDRLDDAGIGQEVLAESLAWPVCIHCRSAIIAAILTLIDSGGSTHHELLLIQVGAADGPLQGKRIGLYHVGWKVGDSLDQLKSVYARINALGYSVDALSDHTISQSIYLRDPDGNEVELYVDDPDVDWRHDKSWMESPVKPLTLDS